MGLIICCFTLAASAQETPKAGKDMTIAEIMVEAHKDAKLLRKVVKGDANDAEKKRLLELTPASYTGLAESLALSSD